MVKKYKTDPLRVGNWKIHWNYSQNDPTALPLLVLLKSLAVKLLCRHVLKIKKGKEKEPCIDLDRKVKCFCCCNWDNKFKNISETSRHDMPRGRVLEENSPVWQGVVGQDWWLCCWAMHNAQLWEGFALMKPSTLPCPEPLNSSSQRWGEAQHNGRRVRLKKWNWTEKC